MDVILTRRPCEEALNIDGTGIFPPTSKLRDEGGSHRFPVVDLAPPSVTIVVFAHLLQVPSSSSHLKCYPSSSC